ncbi:MAG: hypothetical protein HXY23_02535 [Parvularculaceae bacterium]|nr:hypothetical protein [Parvularculaceae bacterium]
MERRPFILGAALVLLGGAPAQAEEARAILDRALAVAAAHKNDRYAFTVVYEDQSAKGAGPGATLRFDPRLPEGRRWTLLSPAESSLTKDQKQRLKSLRRSDDADGSLIYDGLAKSAAKAQLVFEDETAARFKGPIDDPEAPEAVVNSMEMTFELSKPEAFVRTVSVHSLKPFKPAAVARVERMVQTQTYQPLVPGGPALLRGSQTIAVGEAMFRKFDQRLVTEYRDFELVGPHEVGAAEGENP